MKPAPHAGCAAGPSTEETPGQTRLQPPYHRVRNCFITRSVRFAPHNYRVRFARVTVTAASIRCVLSVLYREKRVIRRPLPVL